MVVVTVILPESANRPTSVLPSNRDLSSLFVILPGLILGNTGKRLLPVN